LLDLGADIRQLFSELSGSSLTKPRSSRKGLDASGSARKGSNKAGRDEAKPYP
jgi:hypothetical protein